MRKKPITFAEAAPRPWSVMESKGGKLYIYAAGESQPISIIKSRRRLTRREIATMHLMCEAVNRYSGARNDRP